MMRCCREARTAVEQAVKEDEREAGDPWLARVAHVLRNDLPRCRAVAYAVIFGALRHGEHLVLADRLHPLHILLGMPKAPDDLLCSRGAIASAC